MVKFTNGDSWVARGVVNGRITQARYQHQPTIWRRKKICRTPSLRGFEVLRWREPHSYFELH